MAQNLTTVGFDADDTLWHNERFFQLTQDRFAELLADHADPDHLADRLLQAERRNIGHYGFGIKGFVLSMIETALEVTDNRVPGEVIAQLIAAGQDMLAHPIELLPHVEDVVGQVADRYRVILVTKGDLLDQERKLAQSGLGDLFDAVEIVSDKTTPVYQDIFDRHAEGPQRGMMVGNSMKSDVVPMIDAGGWGVFVPGQLTWALEHAEAPEDHPKFYQINDLSGLTDILDAVG
ncbi:HAD family hydrolase [Pseudooceanicola sp. MF1-13]|uniref:HAD family hydrolase n=1 Tax=Pseudooceanicola sp. MF1-13 TaxID=3379095 RepID=UPI003891F759